MPNFAVKVLLALVCAILGYIILAPLIEDATYRVRRRLYARRHPELVVGQPHTRYSFPFGVRGFAEMVMSARRRETFAQLRRVQERSGFRATVREQALGQFIIFTVDPENIKAMLATQFKDFGLGFRHGAFAPLLGEGIFTLDGNGWHHSRAMLRPQFTRQQISHLSTIEGHLQKMLAVILGSPSTTISIPPDSSAEPGSAASSPPKRMLGPVDLQDLFFKLTIDTATEFLFGESVDMFSGGNPRIAHSAEFGAAFNRAQEFLANRVRAQGFYSLVDSPEFQKWCAVCRAFTDSFVELALERYHGGTNKDKDGGSSEKKYVFLDELVKDTQDPDVLRDQALNILLAGRDTTASVLSWAFYLLARHKRVFHKLRREVLLKFGPGPPGQDEEGRYTPITFESLKACTYLKYVLDEVLRLYPVIPANMRTSVVDTTLPRGGRAPGSTDAHDESAAIFVPRGTAVFYCVRLMHEHPAVWGRGVDGGVPVAAREDYGGDVARWQQAGGDDARAFRPERWAEGISKDRHAWAFLPFNGGPRICLGQQFALNEMSYAIVRVLQTFSDIELVHPERREEVQLTMSVFEGLPMYFTKATPEDVPIA